MMRLKPLALAICFAFFVASTAALSFLALAFFASGYDRSLFIFYRVVLLVFIFAITGSLLISNYIHAIIIKEREEVMASLLGNIARLPFISSRLRRKKEFKPYFVIIIALAVLLVLYIVLPGVDYAVKSMLEEKIIFMKLLAALTVVFSFCYSFIFKQLETFAGKISFTLGIPTMAVALFEIFIR